MPRKNHGHVGPIIYTGVGILLLPKFTDYPDGETALCGGVLQARTPGCNRPTCKLDHLAPKAWKKPKKKMMIAHVKATPDCTWNMAVVDNKWLGIIKPIKKASD